MLSYAQRFEDMHLLRALGAQGDGFYIDVGAGHPVYDNVSLAFYLKGWRGITVEPNPWLSELSAAVRPRDIPVQALVASAPGEASYFLIEDFHGLSTTVAGNARAALDTYGKAAREMSRPVTTLAALCERHAPAAIDFLKIDVEGAEREVLLGNDWSRFRPRIVMLEALAPVTMQPSWDDWESLLIGHGYRFALFDTLNRYYVAEEHADLAAKLGDAPADFAGVTAFRDLGPAKDDPAHPDHRLAQRLAGLDPIRLPLGPREALLACLTKGMPVDSLDAAAGADAVATLGRDLCGDGWTPPSLHRGATIRDALAAWVDSEAFRIALGRISASSAW